MKKLLHAGPRGRVPAPPGKRWLVRMVGRVLDRGVPVHGVGLQYHTRLENAPTAEDVAANIERFNQLGLDVEITEMDIWIRPRALSGQTLAAQTAAYRAALQTARGLRCCSAAVLRGFTDAHSWIPSFTKNEYGDALIFDCTYQPKPACFALCDVLAKGHVHNTRSTAEQGGAAR